MKMKKVQTIKLVGVKINLQKISETKTQLITKCETAPKFVGLSISLRARARKFETFIISKIIYQLRHYNNCKTFMKKLNSQLIDHLWMGKKHCVNQKLVNTSQSNCGIGVKNLNKAVLTAKIMNLKFIAYSKPTLKYLDSYNNSQAFKYLEEELKKKCVEIITFDLDVSNIQYFFQSFDVTKNPSKQIYEFLMKSIITIPCFAHVNKTAMKQKVSPKIVMRFLETIWKKKNFMSFDKNHLYLFLMNSYLDKQKKWLRSLVPRSLCFGCGHAFETWDHLLFQCSLLEKTRKSLNINTWKDVWADKRGLAQQYLVAIILYSWSE